MGSQTKHFRTGDGSFTDFTEFLTREPCFSVQHFQSRNSSINNASNSTFPSIGTFQLEPSSSSSSASLIGNSGIGGIGVGGGGGLSSPQVYNNSTGDQPAQTELLNINPFNIMCGNMFNVSQNNHQQSNNVFNASNNNNNNNNNNNTNNNTNNNVNNSNQQQQQNGGDLNQGTRETGIIEKLLHSYGFIQCCDRQARLFFHFSQFSGNIEHLKIGDPVEFEMTYDRRTGKPIASQVTKIAPEVVLSEERVTGTVTTEIKSENSSNTSTNTNETTGRISYENRGECFFLPYHEGNIEGNVTLRAGDKVSFQIATNQRGNLGACHIRLENPIHPVKYRGVVCSMKESFGFIERADVVKEIFFHFSEAEGSIELRPGDDVEFLIQTRNGKEVACNITRLVPGSVIFEDVDTVVYKGQVLKPLDRNTAVRHTNDPLPGRIRYRAADHSEVEVPFGDKDQKGDFTLRHGDWVQFLLATDRRDQLQRASSISLLDETFKVSGEKREQGVVNSLKEGFGFIRCVERSARLFFHFTEVLDTAREVCLNDEVEFTVVQDPGSSFCNNRQSAIRIKHLPIGTVIFENLIEQNLQGVITREAPKSPTKSLERTEGGVISYMQSNNKKTIMYFLKDCEKPPRAGDNVKFNICQVIRNKELIAINVQEIHISNETKETANISSAPAGGGSGTNTATTTTPTTGGSVADDNLIENGRSNKSTTHQGFIAVLKENFGFIETVNHEEEIFFHFSHFIGNPNSLELGVEVEYSLSSRLNGSNSGNCLPAEHVKILPKGTIQQPKVLDDIFNGFVVRPLRCINPSQSDYSGLIRQAATDGETDAKEFHLFGITSLTNKRDLLQKDDAVTFKIDAEHRAAEVTAVRKKSRANVDSIKGQFGFLDYEVEDGKKLFFHMTEVMSNANNLHSGDTVEFSVITNQRTGKSSACNVKKISENYTRPERLLSRLKINNIDENVPRLVILRSPKGPDGSKGFSPLSRVARVPGELLPTGNSNTATTSASASNNMANSSTTTSGF